MHRLASTALIAGTVVALISGCGNTGGHGEDADLPAATSATSAASTTSNSDEAETSLIDNTQNHLVAVRRGIFVWGCYEGAGAALNNSAMHPDVFIQVPGKTRQSVAKPSTLAQTTATACAVVGNNSAPSIAYATATAVPSSGLTPASTKIVLEMYEPRTTSRKAERTIANLYQPSSYPGMRLYGTADGVVLQTTDAADRERPIVTHFRTRDLAPSWSVPGVLLASSGGTVSIYQRDPESRSGQQHGRTVFLNSADGAELSSYSASYESEFDAIRLTRLVKDAYVFSFVGRAMKPNGAMLVNDKTGQIEGKPVDDADDILVDEFSELILVERKGFEVLDRGTGQSRFTISPDQVYELGIQDVAIANSRLYVANASDSPVLDALTGRVEHAGWSQRPIARLENQTVVAEGSSRTDGIYDRLCGGFGVNENAFGNSQGSGPGYLLSYFRCSRFKTIEDVDGKFPGPNF